MKILTNKEYGYLKSLIQDQEYIGSQPYKYQVETLKEEVKKLKEELKQARNLNGILEKMTKVSFNDSGLLFSSSFSGFIDDRLSDNVAIYVDDILGGKVIKQEGNKCFVIDKNGSLKEGLTKQKVDKGFSYKLIREK